MQSVRIFPKLTPHGIAAVHCARPACERKCGEGEVAVGRKHDLSFRCISVVCCVSQHRRAEHRLSSLKWRLMDTSSECSRRVCRQRRTKAMYAVDERLHKAEVYSTLCPPAAPHRTHTMHDAQLGAHCALIRYGQESPMVRVDGSHLLD